MNPFKMLGENAGLGILSAWHHGFGQLYTERTRIKLKKRTRGDPKEDTLNFV